MISAVLQYHERSKHHFDTPCGGRPPADPELVPARFRHYEGAPRIPLEQVCPEDGPTLDAIHCPGEVESAEIRRHTVAQLLFDSLAITGWVERSPAPVPLRCCPSVGNTQPLEAYLLLPDLPDLPGGLYHYSPWHHALERRAELELDLDEPLLLLGLSSLLWRVAARFGDRAFRYCQHDVGAGLASISYAAAALGWRATPLACEDDVLRRLLGLESQAGPEAEAPEALLGLWPTDRAPPRLDRSRLAALADQVAAALRDDVPSPISRRHVSNEVLDTVSTVCRRAQAPEATFVSGWLAGVEAPTGEPAVRPLLRGRRCAHDLDGSTPLPRADFVRMLRRCLPRQKVPFGALPSSGSVHLLLFVHRVEGLTPGIYALLRDPDVLETLSADMDDDFEWSQPDLPGDLPLYLLLEQDVREAARSVTCYQNLASDGAFTASMLARFRPFLEEHGPWGYRWLQWEAGALGHTLAVEAEASGVSAGVVARFYDDAMHELLGMDCHDRSWQVVVQLAVGTSLPSGHRVRPAYRHLKQR